MNLKEQLRILMRNYEKEVEEKKREEEKKKIRTQEDWEIIEEYLKNLLIQLASSEQPVKISFKRKKFIPIDCGSNCIRFPRNNDGKALYLKDGERLEITDKDIERFCNQHNLELKYRLDKKHDFMVSNKYKIFETDAFLIGV